MDKFTIIQDTREKTPWLFTEDDVCYGSLVKKLNTGDYSIEGLESVVAIERKRTTAEIALNICEQRFKNELERLRDFKYKYLICEFDYNAVEQFPIGSGIPRHRLSSVRVSPAFLRGSLLSFLTVYNLPVIFAGDADNAATIAYHLLKKIAKLENLIC